jgi:hypothetical protein
MILGGHTGVTFPKTLRPDLDAPILVIELGDVPPRVSKVVTKVPNHGILLVRKVFAGNGDEVRGVEWGSWARMTREKVSCLELLGFGVIRRCAFSLQDFLGY